MFKFIICGRFSPFHKGHEKLLKDKIEFFGYENVLLILCASNNKRTYRTPFTDIERIEIIKNIFPNLKINLLLDYNNQKVWEKILATLVDSFAGDFFKIYCCGSFEDGRWYKGIADKIEYYDRFDDNISGTLVRELLIKKYIKKENINLNDYLHKSTIEYIENLFKFNKEFKEIFRNFANDGNFIVN